MTRNKWPQNRKCWVTLIQTNKIEDCTSGHNMYRTKRTNFSKLPGWQQGETISPPTHPENNTYSNVDKKMPMAPKAKVLAHKNIRTTLRIHEHFWVDCSPFNTHTNTNTHTWKGKKNEGSRVATLLTNNLITAEREVPLADSKFLLIKRTTWSGRVYKN